MLPLLPPTGLVVAIGELVKAGEIVGATAGATVSVGTGASVGATIGAAVTPGVGAVVAVTGATVTIAGAAVAVTGAAVPAAGAAVAATGAAVPAAGAAVTATGAAVPATGVPVPATGAAVAAIGAAVATGGDGAAVSPFTQVVEEAESRHVPVQLLSPPGVASKHIDHVSSRNRRVPVTSQASEGWSAMKLVVTSILYVDPSPTKITVLELPPIMQVSVKLTSLRKMEKIAAV